MKYKILGFLFPLNINNSKLEYLLQFKLYDQIKTKIIRLF